jgi:hypothetical protein
MVTGDTTYNATVRPKITIKSIDGLTTLFTYNAFAGSNPVNVTYCDTEGAVGESGVFNLRLRDNEGLVDGADIHNVKVLIQLGKSEATLQYFMIGYGDVFQTGRPVTNIKDYLITGFGSAIWSSQLFIHRREASDIQNIENPTVTGDSNFNANKLVKRALESKNWRPLKDKSIKDITGWKTTGISNKVSTNIPVINAPFTYVNDFMDNICAITGAVWFIDYSTGEEVFTLSFNPDLHTGITIKSGDLMVRSSDPGDTTSYIKTAFNVEDNATLEAGVATRAYSTTIINQTTVSSSFVNQGSTTLDFKAIAQQVVIDSDARRINSLAFVLSKVGEPDSPKSRINGDICLDNGHNSPRNGTILDEFAIDIASIEDSPRTIFVNDIDVKERLLEGGQKKIWLRLFQRSGTSGDPQHDPANTIRWHHNGVFNSTPVLATYSGTAEEGDKDKKEELDWKNTNLGPTYTYSIFSDIKKMQARTNKQAANNLRLREVFVPTEFLQNSKLITEYLSLLLGSMSKPRRQITSFKATIPNNFIFKPYQLVSFADGLSGITDTLQVKRVQYILSSDQGDPQIGTLHADLTLGGLYNPLIGNCECL